MATPYNYSTGVQPVNILQTMQYGQAMQASQARQQAQKIANEKAQLANQQVERQVAAIDVFQALESPGLADYQSLGVALGGEHVTKLGEAFQQQTDAENAATIQFGGQFMSALNNSPEYAVQMLDDRIAASQGDPQTAGYYSNMRKMLADEQGIVDPETLQNVKMMVGTTLAAVPGADVMFNALETRQDILKKQQMVPEELRKAKAEATSAANTANFAQLRSVTELAALGLDVSGQLEDPKIQKEVKRLAVLNNQVKQAKSGMEMRKLQLDIFNSETAIAEASAEKANEINSLGDKIKTTQSQIKKIQDLGAVSNYFIGDVTGAATGPVGSRILTLDSDVANFEEALAVLDSQVFLNNVEQMRGLGTLTDAEGKRLSNASGSLSLRQSRKQFNKELGEISKLLDLADKNRLKKYPNAVEIPAPVVLGQDVRTMNVPGIGQVTITQE